MKCHDVEHNLDACVDRELDAEAARAFSDHLETCSACRRLVSEREALGRVVRSAPHYAAPDRLRARVVAQARRSRSVSRVLTWAAAAVVVLSVGGGIGLLRSNTARAGDLAEDVVSSHVRSLMADHLLDVQSTDRHTVKPWFLGKIDFSPSVVDLAPIGFPLVGGRLDYLGGRPSAALVYQRQKHTINVFVTSEGSGAGTPAYVRSIRGFHVHHWVRDGLSFWAVSDLNDAELSDFVRALEAS